MPNFCEICVATQANVASVKLAILKIVAFYFSPSIYVLISEGNQAIAPHDITLATGME